MGDFYIPIGAPEPPFTFGTCKYKVTKVKPQKNGDGKKSLLVIARVIDRNGVSGGASIFFDAKKVREMTEFCEVNGMSDILESQKFTATCCEGKGGGLCNVERAKNEKYKDITGFLSGEMPPPTHNPVAPVTQKDEIDDDIPF